MNITLNAYSPDGFKVTLTADVLTMKDALAFSDAAAKSGFTLTPVERREELITTVVRREHVDDKGSVTPVIDMYPTWKGDYGQFRFTGVYLNTPDDIAQFEAHAGLRLTDIPLYDSEMPLKRKTVRMNPVETKCKPFMALKRAAGEKEIDGTLQVVWKFAGYASAASSIPVTVTDSTPSPDAPLASRPVLPAAGSMRPASVPSASQSGPRQGR